MAARHTGSRSKGERGQETKRQTCYSIDPRYYSLTDISLYNEGLGKNTLTTRTLERPLVTVVHLSRNERELVAGGTPEKRRKGRGKGRQYKILEKCGLLNVKFLYKCRTCETRTSKLVETYGESKKSVVEMDPPKISGKLWEVFIRQTNEITRTLSLFSHVTPQVQTQDEDCEQTLKLGQQFGISWSLSNYAQVTKLIKIQPCIFNIHKQCMYIVHVLQNFIHM